MGSGASFLTARRVSPGGRHAAARTVLAPVPLTLALVCAACKGGPLALPPVFKVPLFTHVFLVVEENTNYGDVIGSSAMPYLNSLVTQYASANEYYANVHPSIGNYFMLTVGDTITNNDQYSAIVTADNIVRELVAAGKTWKAYAEDLPAAGYTGPDTGRYARRHNILALVSDVVNSRAQVMSLVPFTQLAADIAANALPNYGMIVPNLCNDAHDCPLSTADKWLQAHIDPLIQNPEFQQNGLLIILFDEARSDNSNGGGQVAWVVVSPKVRRGYRAETQYQHQSTLRLSAQALGLTVFPNRAAVAPPMGEFFTQ